MLLYFFLSFVQALILVRAMNKQWEDRNPVFSVLFITALGPIATLIFLCGVFSAAIDRFVKGE